MRKTVRSCRFYFWPIIAANSLAMTLGLGGNWLHALSFSIVISSLASFGFLFNDLWDRDIDRVNGAGHFEHSSRSELYLGSLSAVGFLAFGICLACTLGRAELRLASAIAVTLALYTPIFRRLLLLPSLVTALLATSPLWGPLLLWHSADTARWAFISANALIVVAREILMDIRDHSGDILGGRDTIATIFGRRISAITAAIVSAAAAAILIGTFASSMGQHSLAGNCAAATSVALILYLAVHPIIRAVMRDDVSNKTVQHHVIVSRFAMALIPVLTIVLWPPQV